MRRSGLMLACLALAALAIGVVEAAVAPALVPPIDELGADAVKTAPQWQVGDWWQVRARDIVQGDEVRATIVLATASPDGYLFGITEPDKLTQFMLFHVPYLGTLSADLAWTVHDKPTQLIRFPAREGEQWDTWIEGDPVHAFVERADEAGADLRYVRLGGEILGTAHYDARHGMFTDYSYVNFVDSELLASGHGFRGTVWAPLREHDAFMGYAATDPTAPHLFPAAEPLDVAEERQHVAVTLLMEGTGTFRSRLVSPNGQEYVAELTPADGRDGAYRMFTSDESRGTWTIEQTILGAGYAWFEGVGFDVTQEDVVPSACGDCGSEPEAATASTAEAPAGGPWFVAAAVLALGAAFTLVRVRWPAPILWLFARLRREDVGSQETRRRILALLGAEPGLRAQEIRGRLGLGWGTVVHHMDVLTKLGFLDVVPWGRDRDYYRRGDLDPRQRALCSAVRREGARQVLEAIRGQPGIAQVELSRRLAVHHGTVRHHVARLERLGLLRSETHGGRRRYAALV